MLKGGSSILTHSYMTENDIGGQLYISNHTSENIKTGEPITRLLDLKQD